MWERQERFSNVKGAYAMMEKDENKVSVPSIDDIVQGMQETGLQYGEYVRRYNK